jgi:hypothetical protein
LTEWIDGKTGDRADSYRKLLIFPKGEFMYMLSHSNNAFATNSMDWLVEKGPEVMGRVYGKIDFH